MQYAIQLNKISKRFNQGYVLNEINFGVKTGEIFGFLVQAIRQNNDSENHHKSINPNIWRSAFVG